MAKDIKDWNQQVKIAFDVTHDGRLIARMDNVWLPKTPWKVSTAKHLCNHFVDFLLVHSDNTVELVELKSDATRTSTWKLKLKLLQAALLREHPNIKYTIA